MNRGRPRADIAAPAGSVMPEADHLFGYTILDDFSARDLLRREMKVNLWPAKGKDFGSALGPWLVTADELDGYIDDEGFLAVEMSIRVNDVEMGRDLCANMGWPSVTSSPTPPATPGSTPGSPGFRDLRQRWLSR